MNLNLNFSESKPINLVNVENMRKITVKTSDTEGHKNPVRIITKRCDSFGVKSDVKYNTKSISIILDEDSVEQLKEIILKCEEHLKTNLSKILYERDDGTTTIYPKIRDWSIFYGEDNMEIDPMKYFRKSCEVKAVLEIEGIILKEDTEGCKASLQVKIYEAKVYKKVYKHVRILDME